MICMDVEVVYLSVTVIFTANYTVIVVVYDLKTHVCLCNMIVPSVAL